MIMPVPPLLIEVPTNQLITQLMVTVLGDIWFKDGNDKFFTLDEDSNRVYVPEDEVAAAQDFLNTLAALRKHLNKAENKKKETQKAKRQKPRTDSSKTPNLRLVK